MAASTPTAHLDRLVASVLDRVVEEGPQDLVELIGVGDRQPAAGPVFERELDALRPERLPGPTHARGEGEDVGLGPERPGLEPADRQQLADHPAQPVGLLGDDPEATVRTLGGEPLGVGADARERRLEVVADPAQEVVLGGVELEEPGVLGTDPFEQLGVPDRDPDLAGEQLEEVLVGPIPDHGSRAGGRRAVRAARRRPGGRPGPAAARPGTRSSAGTVVEVDQEDPRVDHPKGRPGVIGGPADQPVDAVARRGRDERGEDPSELAVPALELGGEPVVALGETGRARRPR